MKIVVISGINLFRGGTLKVMQECIAAVSDFVDNDTMVYALVHNEEQYPTYPNVKYFSFPKSRKSYLNRLYYEYIGFKKLSKQWNPYCWISMHDTTPNVTAKKRVVYCHNTFAFLKTGLKDLYLQPSIYLFSKFSRYIHKINIKKNDYVIVQQEWLRKDFEESFGLDNVIVSLPVHESSLLHAEPLHENPGEKKEYLFFYPSTPMVHKNFEMVCKAFGLLKQNGVDNAKLTITLDGTEDKYAQMIYDKYHMQDNVIFTGFLNRQQMSDYYNRCDAVVFMSKIESWGLPVSEAKEFNKSVFVSDLPYAKETIGKYDKAKFLAIDDYQGLADAISQFIKGELRYDDTEAVHYKQPFARDWNELISLILPELKKNS
jgi:Glycosyltransferase